MNCVAQMEDLNNAEPLNNGYTVQAQLANDYNTLDNILRLFDVLPNFPFTTSEKLCDYYL